MWNTPEFKVGFLVVIVASLIGVMSLKVAEGPGIFVGRSHYWFEVDDAGGLIKNSAVKMAGIKVGVIDRIELINGRARIHIRLDGDTPVATSTIVQLKADGILGDKHVELLPGKLGDPALPSDSQITRTEDRGSLDQLVGEIGKISSSLSELAKNLNNATRADGDESTAIGRIVLNIEKLTSDLSHITSQNKEKFGDILDRIESIASSVDHALGDESPAGFKTTWSRLDQSLKNLEEITQKINDGKGSVGKLINDEETVDQINSAVENVNMFLGGFASLETGIDFHSEYLTTSTASKSFLTIRLQPGIDRYYELGIVDGPRHVSETTETRTTTNPGGTTETLTTQTFRDRLKFTALFAKNIFDFTIKGGIMESAGGVGLDYHLLSRDLRLSVELFNFGDPYLRAFARYNLLHGLYLIGGGDNLLDPRMANAFIGGGLFLTNDDLKIFATRVNF